MNKEVIETRKMVRVYDKELDLIMEYELYPANGDVATQALAKYRECRSELSDEQFENTVSIIKIY